MDLSLSHHSDDTSDDEPAAKRQKLDSSPVQSSSYSQRSPLYGYLFIPPTPEHNSDPESQYSFQNYETEYVQDTEDTDTTVSPAKSPVYDYGEYDPPSPSDNENPIEENSDVDSRKNMALSKIDLQILVEMSSNNETEKESEGQDMYRETSSSDSELQEGDLWECLRCKQTKNKPPMRYCTQCYKLRKNWLPNRPRPRFKRNGKRCNTTNEDIMDKLPSITTTDSGIYSGTGSNPSSQELDILELRGQLPPYQLGCINLSWSNIPIIGLVHDCVLVFTLYQKQEPLTEPVNMVCEMCCVRAKDSAFVHGSIGHQHGCYQCSMQVLKTSGRCPVCRHRIKNVIQLYVS